MPKASTRKAQRLIPRFSPTMQARADKRELTQRIRLEKDVQRLSRELERLIRTSDYRLLNLAARLLSRGAAVERGAKVHESLSTLANGATARGRIQTAGGEPRQDAPAKHDDAAVQDV